MACSLRRQNERLMPFTRIWSRHGHWFRACDFHFSGQTGHVASILRIGLYVKMSLLRVIA